MTEHQQQIAQRLAALGKALDPTFDTDAYYAEVTRLYAASDCPAESSAPSPSRPCAVTALLVPHSNATV